MQIIFSQDEALKLFNDAICNGLGEIGQYGIELRYKQTDYNAAKQKLNSPCYEDVLTQILRDGNSLRFVDLEGGVETVKLNLDMLMSNLTYVPLFRLVNLLDGEGDATDSPL